MTLLLLLPIALLARDNPFAPNDPHKTLKPHVRKAKIHPQRHVVRPKVSADTSKQEQTTATAAIKLPKSIHSKTEPKIHPKRKHLEKEVVNYEKARFVFSENSVSIETKDKIIKHFSIAKPPSIVIDYKAKSDFASKRKVLSTKPFKKLEMGSHRTRYRVVFRLERKHQYVLTETKYGQRIKIVDK